MFLRNSNGFLINLSTINRINIEITERFCQVVAHLNDGVKEILYRDIEIDECKSYLEDLSRKLAINFEVWEN